MRRLLTGLCLAVPVLVSACGTTVPLTHTVSGAQSQLDGGSGSGLTDPGSVSGTGGSTSGSTSGTGGSTSGSTSGTGGSTSGSTSGGTTGSTSGTSGSTSGSASGTTTGSSAGLTGRGVTATTITLGIALPTGTDTLANTFGVSGGGSASPAAIVDTVVKDVNKSGGILGRKLAVYVHSYDAVNAVANPSQAFQAICTDFRDDHKVFAVVFDIIDPIVRKCLAAIKTPLVVLGGFTVVPEAAFKENGGNYLFGPSSLTIELEAKLFIQSLVDRMFFEKWDINTGKPGGVAPSRLGLIHVDTPDQNALYAAYAKELKKHGMTFTDTVVYAQDAGSALAATQNAALKFRADGITQVFGASAFFLRDADSQNYKPRYAFLPGLGKLGADNVPASQMNGALTVGWTPASDVAASEDPGNTVASRHCKMIMNAAGLSTADRSDLATMYKICDSLYSIRAALTAAKTPTVPGLRHGFEALGTSFKPALTFTTTFSPTQHYGVSSVRDMEYIVSCKCLKYTSKTDRR